ncbi:MAG TPA: TonB-dependent receptor [Vicinamibacterales bacterium]|nr:TonB-dependent receptor [Vicinamibacterales bacterium]
MATSFRSVKAVRVLACVCAVLCVPLAALAQTPQEIRDELDKLRKEFETVRDSYGARLSALEAKLAQMKDAKPAGAETPAQPAAAQPPATPPGQPPAAPPAQPGVPAPGTEVQAPPGAAGAGGPTGTLPVYGSTSALSKIFNPDIAVIGNFLGAVGENEINPSPAFALDEAEATFQAIVDPYARADFFLSFSPEGVEIEEGFLTLTSLPGGLLAKVGKFKEQVGKVNTLHPHSLPWVDNPLMVDNLFGGSEGLSDSGISVSKLILNPWVFLEATGEIYKGDSGIFTSHTRSDISWVGRLRGYRDVTEATNVDIGASFTSGSNELGSDFKTQLYGIDATVRYRPLRRAIYRRFQGRTELFWSRRDQELENVHAFGMYASGEYQFARRWFAGARYDWSERAYDASLVDKGPSFLVTYWPSEFSQIRGQYRRTRYAERSTANEVLFQFLFSIGAHGAHVF